MTPDRWQRIEQVYFAALACAPQGRAALLDAACDGDEALRSEVESLLAAHQQASGFLAEPALEVMAEEVAGEKYLAQAGQILNQYQILSPLGAGGMGVVYKALDLKLGRTVALKMLAPALVTDQTARLRFLREARAASMLAHPNICTVFEVGQSDNLVYIAMQYLHGKTLADLLSESQIPITTALGYALDIADALDEAHGHGIIHRDIKPTNIIVNERGKAIVLDFGLAKYIGAGRAYDGDAPTLLQITEALSPIGTPAYMSPEQVRGQPLDARSDIFSFGVMLYELVTGLCPFRKQSQMDTLHAILYHDPPLPLTVRPTIRSELNDLIRKTLAKDSGQRYQSFADLKADLTTLLSEKSNIKGAIPLETRAAEATVLNDATITNDARVNITEVGAATITERILRPLLRRRTVTILAVAALVIIAVWLVWRLTANRSDAEMIASLKQVELVNWKEQAGVNGNGVLGSISPDGKMIAYFSKSDRYGNIWVKQTSSGDPFQITKDDWNNWSPIWSPDGQEVAYISRRGRQTGIWRIPSFGGAPRLIATLATAGGQLNRWSKDGKTIYCESDGNFIALDVDSSQSRALTHFDSQSVTAVDFSISPAEDRIAYAEVREGQKDIWVEPVAGGSPVQITNGPEDDSVPIWHPDGKRILYSSKRDDVFQIFVTYLDGRKPEQITFGDRDSFMSGISDDGTKIAISSARQDSDLWAVDVNTGEETQITNDVHAEMWADISPDGRYLAYQFMRYTDDFETSRILLRPRATAEQRVELATAGMEPRWSPDGKMLASLRLEGGLLHLWKVNASGTNEMQLTPRGISGFNYTVNPYNRFYTSEFSWSPDSRRIAFTTATAEQGIWIVDADGQNETRALPTPGASTAFYCPVWSPDGKSIVYLSSTQTDTQIIWEVSIVEVGKNNSRTLYQSNSVLRLLGWSSSGNALVVATAAGKAMFAASPATVGLFELSADKGSVRQIATAESAYLYNNQLSSDKRSIAIALRRDGKDNIWLYPMTAGDPKKITSNNDSRLFLSSLTWSPDGKAIYFAEQSRFGVMSMIANYK